MLAHSALRPLAGAALIDGGIGEPAAERDQQVRVLGGAVEHDRPSDLVVAACDSGRRGSALSSAMSEKEPPTIIAGHAGAGQRPAVLALDEGVGLVVGSSRRPSARDGRVDQRRRAPATPRPIIATGSPAGCDRDRVHVDRGDDRRRAARSDGRRNSSAPSRPISSAVVARNRMSRAGRGRAGEPAGDLDQHRDAARIVDRAVADPVRRRPPGRQMPRWSQWASSSRLSPVAAAAAQAADHIVAGVGG